MRFIFILIALVIIHSCNNIEFVYDDKKNLTNPLYEKTLVTTSGFDIAFLKFYIPMFFGNTTNQDFNLSILIQEKQIKRSIETNQAVSNLRYELRFFYKVKKIEKDCIVFEKEILSSFSITPKSAGFNYGTDVSLEKKYELAITENMDQFISYLSNQDLNSCL